MFTKIKPLIIVFLLLIPAVSFFFKPGIYWNMHDDMQLIRQMELEKCLSDGQIPCRWTPDLGYGYGYPLFNFYPPLPYYVGEFFRIIGYSYISTVKLTAALQFFTSALGMYLLASTLFGPIGGVISSLFYTYAPYHAVNVYVRGAMNEAWASSFFPFIFLFAYLAIKTPKPIYYLLLSLFYCFLLLSHNPMAMIFSPFLGIWILYWLYIFRPRQILKSIFHLGLSLLFSIMLSAYFTLPVIVESKLVQIESMFQNYYHYSVHFVSFYQLFFSNFWGDGPSIWGPNDGMSFAIGYLHWIFPIICLILSLYNYYKTKKINFLIPLLFILSLASLFLTHERSTPIWQLITVIQKVQFPWRFLNISTFLVSLLSGSIISLLNFRPHIKIYLLTIVIFILLSLNLKHFYPVTSGPINDDQKFSGTAWTNQVTGGIYDYLPKTAQKAAIGPAKEFIDQINPTDTNFQIYGQKKGTDWIFLNIKLNKPATITLPLLYFPNFKLFLDNQLTDIKYETSLGRIQIDVTAGDHQIYIKLHNTFIRTFGNIITMFSILIFLFLFNKWLWTQPKSNK